MQIEQLSKDYLNEARLMQIATSVNDYPWSCTVYYVNDGLKLYWMSLPTRRHSLEIEQNPQVAVSVPIYFEEDKRAVGVQMEGTARVVEDEAVLKKIGVKYAGKYGRDAEWQGKLVSNRTLHKMYEFNPSLLVLFDDLNFPDNPRQSVSLA